MCIHLQSRPMTRYLPVRDDPNVNDESAADAAAATGSSTSSSSFNLRRFIESAGHSLDDPTTSSVTVTPSACHGWLVKRAGSRRLHVWHRRYFLFDRTWRTLSWYSSRVNPSTVPRPPQAAGSSSQVMAGGGGSGRCSAVPFSSIVDVFVDHQHLGGRGCPSPSSSFCVKTRDRNVLYLAAPTAETMRIWVDVLVTGAEGYGEF